MAHPNGVNSASGPNQRFAAGIYVAPAYLPHIFGLVYDIPPLQMFDPTAQQDGSNSRATDVTSQPAPSIAGVAQLELALTGIQERQFVLVDHEVLPMQSVDPDSADVFNDAGELQRGDSSGFDIHSEVARRTA